MHRLMLSTLLNRVTGVRERKAWLKTCGALLLEAAYDETTRRKHHAHIVALEQQIVELDTSGPCAGFCVILFVFTRW